MNIEHEDKAPAQVTRAILEQQALLFSLSPDAFVPACRFVLALLKYVEEAEEADKLLLGFLAAVLKDDNVELNEEKLEMYVPSQIVNSLLIILCRVTEVVSQNVTEKSFQLDLISFYLDACKKFGALKELASDYKWVESFSLKDEVKMETYKKLYALFKESMLLKEALDVVLKYFKLAAAHKTIDNALLKSVVLDCIRDLDYFDLLVFKDFEVDDVVLKGLVDQFLTGSMSSYTKFAESNKPWFEKNSLDMNAMLNKMKFYAICELFAANLRQKISFKQVSESISEKEENVEMWVIDATCLELVKGKINQEEKTIVVQNSSCREVTKNEWQKLSTFMDGLKNSVKNAQTQLEQAKQASTKEPEAVGQ